VKYLFAGLKALTLVVFITCAAGGARAATWTVTKTQDTNDGVCSADCSLREAVDVANSGDTIVFSTLFNSPQTLTLTNGVIGLNKDLTIDGPGADLLTIDANNGVPFHNVFFIESWATATLREMTLTNSGVNMFSSIGNTGTVTVEQCSLSGNLSAAGILNLGTATIDSSTISENNGANSGGIENYGVLTLTNSTVSNNHADFIFTGGSGGIYSDGDSLTITNSTVSGNLKSGANDNGGGIWTNNQTTITASTIANNEVTLSGANNASGVFAEAPAIVTVRNTIIAANVNNSTMPDVLRGSPAAGFISGGFNLIGNIGTYVSAFINLGDQTGTGAAPRDPLIDPLGDYGGMTETHRLQASSTAIDKGYSFGLTTDQRGFVRPYDKSNYSNATGGDGSDIGAYELHFTVTMVGIVFDPSGHILRNIRVLIRLPGTREKRAVKTDKFGVYRFNNVARNRTYQISPTHRVYNFMPQTVTVTEENITNLNFTALP